MAYGVTIDFADLDRDGDYDLLVCSGVWGEDYSELYLNQGTPQNAVFELENPNLVGMIESVNPCFVDIDGDNDYDLFYGYYYQGVCGKIVFFENQGDSANYNFTLITWVYLGISNNYPIIIDFADIDRDSDYDLFCCSYISSLSTMGFFYFENIGTPRTANFMLADSFFGDIELGGNIELGDIDNDSDLDLFIGYGNGGVNFYRNLEFNSVNREAESVSRSFTLLPNYPNPFNESTTIPFTLDQKLPVKVVVYNQLGQVVATLLDQLLPAELECGGARQRGVFNTADSRRRTVDGEKGNANKVTL